MSALLERVDAAELALWDALAASGAQFVSRMPEHLREYWVHGEGAAKIRWCTEGSFDRARKALLKEGVPADRVNGTVANLYELACGKHPGRHKD